MEKKLYGYIKHLEESQKSKLSIKNYKADVKQFLNWKGQVSPETSLSKGFALYKAFLESKYSDSSVARKESSIKSFIKFAYPFEISAYEQKTKKDRSLFFLTAFSLSLTAIMLVLFLYPILRGGTNDIEKGLNIGNIKIVRTTEDAMFENKDGIVLSVSAPSIEEDGKIQDFLIPCQTD